MEYNKAKAIFTFQYIEVGASWHWKFWNQVSHFGKRLISLYHVNKKCLEIRENEIIDGYSAQKPVGSVEAFFLDWHISTNGILLMALINGWTTSSLFT